MRRGTVGCLLVCQAARLVGIFTERDLMRRVLAPGRPLTLPVSAVHDAQSRRRLTPRSRSGRRPARMVEGGYRHLPVVDEAGRPVGVLSVKRIVHYLVEHFPDTIYNLPPDPGACPHEPRGGLTHRDRAGMPALRNRPMTHGHRRPAQPARHAVEELESATIRLAGDSGDGMQLAGTQFTNASAILGNDISTLPDFPAEIRAPAGTLAGVSGFQIHFSSHDIFTPGDQPERPGRHEPGRPARPTSRTWSPAASSSSTRTPSPPATCDKAGYKTTRSRTARSRATALFAVPMTTLNRDAVAGTASLSPREADRCKNFFALGLVYWLYERSLDPTLRWIEDKFGKNPAICEANTRAFKAGYNYGETTEALPVHYRVAKATSRRASTARSPATRRLAIGPGGGGRSCCRISAVRLRRLSRSRRPATSCTSSPTMKTLRRRAPSRRKTRSPPSARRSAQPSAVRSASPPPAAPASASSREAIGLAVMTELPVVIIDVQRGGPSTGLPTKTEQADLLQAMFGRNGECPALHRGAAVAGGLLPHGHRGGPPGRRLMTPVFLLSDGYLANGAEPWRIPDRRKLPEIPRRSLADASRNGHGRAQPASCPMSAMIAAGADRGPYPGRRVWSIASVAWRRRHRHRQRQLRSRQPRTHGAHPCREDRQYRQRHPGAVGRRDRRRRPAGHRLGRHVRFAHDSAERRQRSEVRVSPAPTCATSTRLPANPARCSRRYQARCWCPS